MRRSAYSLLEILIATTILVIGLAAIFGLTQSARQRAVAASDLAAVQLFCQTSLNELLAKQQPISPSPLTAISDVNHWRFSVGVYPARKEGLAVVHFTALEFLPQGDIPTGISYQLLRWVPIERVQWSQNGTLGEPANEFGDPFM